MSANISAGPAGSFFDKVQVGCIYYLKLHDKYIGEYIVLAIERHEFFKNSIQRTLENTIVTLESLDKKKRTIKQTAKDLTATGHYRIYTQARIYKPEPVRPAKRFRRNNRNT